MKILIIVVSFFLLLVLNAKAQYPSTNAPQVNSTTVYTAIPDTVLHLESDSLKGPWDHLTIISDSRINQLLEIKKEENRRKGGTDGFRLQLFQGSKDEAYKLKSRFLAKYPDQKIYVLFQTPDFRVRIGDFRDKTEAIRLQHLIDKDFPNSLIVEDIINFPELKLENQSKGKL